MTLTEDDLRELLAGQVRRQPENGRRLPEVHRRIAVARRRRVTASGALALAVAGIALAVALPGSSHRAGIEPTSPTTPPTPYPTYAHGGRAIGGGSLRAGQTSLTFTVTPTSDELYLATTCDGDGEGLSVSVNGEGGGGYATLCGATGSGTTTDPAAGAQQWGDSIHLGKPNTITITLTPAPGSTTVEATLVAAMYQGVPFDDYPLPPKPAGELPAMSDVGVIVRPTTPTADGTFTGRFTAQNGHLVTVDAVGPGLVDVSIDGHHVRTAGFFTWSEDGFGVDTSPSTLATFGVHVAAGQTVTISATATHFSGPYWQITEG